MTKLATSVLNDIVAVQLHVSQWTGRKKLADTDLSLNGEAPPKEIINLGSKHTTDPEALKVFNTIKRRMERACLAVGIPFLGGYAIPSHKADELAKLLTKLTGEYELEKLEYVRKHESIQKGWIEKFPSYEKILVKALTSTTEVEKRISASFSMFQVQSAQSAVSVDAGLSNQVDSLGQTLDADILKSAKKLLDSLTGAIQPNQTNVASLRKLREKVEGLAFLNNRFRKLVDKIKTVESAMPITGKLSTDETHKLSGLLFRMSEEDKLQTLMATLENEDANTATQCNQSLEPLLDTSDVEFDFDSEVESVSNEVQDESFVTVPDFKDSDFEFDFGTTPLNNSVSASNKSTYY
ncbi:DUF3150 domain-containing protein [Vibrio coralliilyticus]|uniref:DUF3150 domain-containing protein n=1 Tax=Vibrio coralliilyticus TaxID=190893 RepID=A0AAP6ZVS9_9VIBR|nr:DUF3150 domain-containing protein [Vibrio coralliilyticus]NOI32250.1 DUF3150 domain-containing protein [Vibrio coralliilyticus]NOJ25334.1 DUF3150 domain-containing protein [Vibrio coralliilyticus]